MRSPRRIVAHIGRTLRRLVPDSGADPRRSAAEREELQAAVAHARVPMDDGDWPEAIRRWRGILERHGLESSWSAHRGIIVAHTHLGHLDEAESAAERAVSALPESVELVALQAELPTMVGDWPAAVERGERLIDRFGSAVPSSGWMWLAVAHEHQGDTDIAALVLQRAREARPDDPEVMRQQAEFSMVRRTWGQALQHWTSYLGARTPPAEIEGTKKALPVRGTAWDWYEEAWLTIARQWGAVAAEFNETPDPEVYLALGDVLRRANLPDERLSILAEGERAHPGDRRLALECAIAQFERYEGPDVTPDTDRLTAFTNGRLLASESDVMEVLSAFAPARHSTTGELGRLFTIRARRDSSVGLLLRNFPYFTQATMERQVRTIAERDAWPEMTSSRDLTMELARELADTFGRRYGDPPFLPAEVLSDSVLALIHNELVVHEPMRRLAFDIATRTNGSPVFIESPADEFRYLDDYPFSNFDVLYLYFELRSLGVNAFLCRYHDDTLPEHSTISFVPGARALVPRGDVIEQDRSTRRSAIVPAGIRSMKRVLSGLDSPLVLSSSSLVEEFAYDRSIRQPVPIEAEASVHPSTSSLPSFTFVLEPAASLDGVALDGEPTGTANAIVEASDDMGGDWLDWLNRVLHTYLAGISENSLAAIDSRNIEEAHICDHLFADSVLFANAVRQRGGRVVLWPHSANPVHVDERRSGTFDEVHAVTRMGCEHWRDRFPDVTVTHSPFAMLDPPSRESPVDPDAPLAVVVFAGQSVRRYMPVLDRTQLEGSYRALFLGIEALQARHPIDLFFKPRGRTGENEMWLTQTVGTTGNWRRVLAHPLRIDLPNMLFVSIGTGSSALIEGLNRGIPGLIVRDFPVRDYTVLNREAIPTLTTMDALATIAACTDPSEYERLVDAALGAALVEIRPDV